MGPLEIMKIDKYKIRLNFQGEYCNIRKVDYQLFSIDSNDLDLGIGDNSSVFKAVRCDTIDEKDPSCFALKVCNGNRRYNFFRLKRFYREINAMKRVAAKKLHFVVKYYGHGNCLVSDYNGSKFNHRSILMELAGLNLRQYLELNEIPIQQRFLLSLNILRGLKDLHDSISPTSPHQRGLEMLG